MSVIPLSSRFERAKENFESQAVELSAEDIKAIGELDRGEKCFHCNEAAEVPGKDPYIIPIFS